MSKFEEIGRSIGELVESKNKAYGNSFGQTGDFLKLLYPEGIKLDQYNDVLLIVRIFDKLKKCASNKKAFNENVYDDIFGYLINLTLIYENKYL